jgi:NAD(P) transhydrogenase subunit beta
MPVLNVDQARSVIVLKRSMSPGFAKIDNELFLRANPMTLFGDASNSLTEPIRALRKN